MASQNMARVRLASLRVTSEEHPGWRTAAGRIPSAGDWVLCVEGEAEVARVLTRLTDGGRLLELRIPGRPGGPFFASSSNVMHREDAEGA